MISSGNFAEAMARWAAHEPSVDGLALFGSQVRDKADPVWGADAHSDWDFHVITSRPSMFLGSAWLKQVTDQKMRAYAVRAPRVGSMPKVNTVLSGCEADFVIISSRVVRLAKLAIGLGIHRHSERLRRGLQDLAVVIRPGWRFLKGAKTWEPFYQSVIREITDPRLNDAEIRNLAEAFVCDYIWALRKIDRGELLAVQRILHRELAETNYRLFHELKLRRGERSFPDARRLVGVATSNELAGLNLSSHLDSCALRKAMEQGAVTMSTFVSELIGRTWQWPDI